MLKTRLITSVALLLMISAAVNAASVTYSGSVPLQRTNWVDLITLPQFDPTLGSLLSIEFSMTGHVEGSSMFESLDAEPQAVTTNVSAEIQLMRPDNSILVVATPVASATSNVTAFDGVVDFTGTSGAVLPLMVNSQTETAAFAPSPSDLLLFQGPGSIALPVWATGQSNASGSGNLVVVFGTQASADVRVTYNYAPVPEPSSFVLALTSLVGIAGVRRVRLR